METIETINARLLVKYGRSINDLPRYRLVWANNQFESRKALWQKHTEAGIFLGEEYAIRTVPKYPIFIDMYVIETPQANDANPELLDKISYEPIWSLQKDGIPIPYNWEIVDMVCYSHYNRPTNLIKTQAQLDHDELEKQQAEAAQILDNLRQDRAFRSKMYDSAVVTIPGKD